MDTPPKQIPFKVSARTARLIGRENVSNADGAIIELIKNSHDADARDVILFFRDNDLFIADNGHGMDIETIENHWMTIGTNNKELQPHSPGGRVKSGAKGIGRFALDRLGHEARVYSLAKDSTVGVIWSVAWDQFEQDNVSDVSSVYAKLSEDADLNLQKIAQELSLPQDIYKHKNTGTIIHISKLRDDWNENMLNELFSNLEVLAAPSNSDTFDIIMHADTHPEKYGAVSSYGTEEYDLKLEAHYDAQKQIVYARLYRSELDINELKKYFSEAFKLEPLSANPYTLDDLSRGYHDVTLSAAELMKGFKDTSGQLTKIGDFDFTIIFSKLQEKGEREESTNYPYRSVNYESRKQWFSKYGGIKIFRDRFRVRPYGEKGDDWLGLGKRQARSPQGPGQGEKGYHFRPNQVTGVVRISRLSNLEFEDKSSREGLQENHTFEVFKNFLLEIISHLEHDRSKIFTALNNYYKQTNKSEKTKGFARNLVAEIAANKDKGGDREYSKEETEQLADAFEESEKDNRKKDDEIRSLRSLASAGLITAATAHELKHLENQIQGRADELKDLIGPFIRQEDVSRLEDYENPYILIDDMARVDKSVLDWLNYALIPLKRDRRKTQSIFLDNYFEGLKGMWNAILKERQIELNVSRVKPELQVKMFPIDLDTIFNNLIVNSIESFRRVKGKIDREIKISCMRTGDSIEIIYQDNGYGLDSSFQKNPSEIFLAQTTSKRNESGAAVGTGMGMYLVKVIVDESKGEIKLISPTKGFGVMINLPVRKKT